MLQRRGWPALSTLAREASGKVDEGLGGCSIDADPQPVLHEHTHASPCAKKS
jgi:hypothetical protein